MKTRDEQFSTAVLALIDRLGTRRAHDHRGHHHHGHRPINAVEVLALLSLARRLGLHRHRALLTAAALALVERQSMKHAAHAA